MSRSDEGRLVPCDSCLPLRPRGPGVKSANILLSSDPPEYAYLTDIGVAEVPGAADTAITRSGAMGSEAADRFSTAADLAIAAAKAAQAD